MGSVVVRLFLAAGLHIAWVRWYEVDVQNVWIAIVLSALSLIP